VVLNAIDDVLYHGREGDRTSWQLADITYLPELLDAARSYRRPVVLVGDHRHVLERSSAVDGLTAAEGVESAWPSASIGSPQRWTTTCRRWRTVARPSTPCGESTDRARPSW